MTENLPFEVGFFVDFFWGGQKKRQLLQAASKP